MSTPTITAEQVHAEAIARHGEGNVGAKELGEIYQSMLDMATREKGAIFYTPEAVVKFMTRHALEQAIVMVGDDDPEQILRIVACEPACGCGIFLVEAANLLAANYAGRLWGRQPNAAQVFAVMPTVILWCCFGIDIDPVAVELARLALSIETGGTLPPEALARHVICGNPLAGDLPPAMVERTGRPAAAGEEAARVTQ